MDRRKFLKVTGSLAVGGLVLSAVGTGVWKLFTRPEEIFNDSRRSKGIKLLKEDGEFVSPYRRTFGFVVDDEIQAMDVKGGSIYLASANTLYIYGMSGDLQTCFPIPSDTRDIVLYEGRIYVLFDARIEVYNREGDMKQRWEACSDDSNYCQMAVCDEGVFVTDMAHKNICRYKLDGQLAGFINSPNGFIIPSACFGISYVDGHIYCSNPGRHLVEVYTTQGEYVRSFGKAGAQEGAFCGCCNPVFITPLNKTDILTSEKGMPRISCYGNDGKFKGLLLDSKALGGGKGAYRMRIMGDKIIVAQEKKVSVFQYIRHQSEQTQCGRCEEECPLKG